MSLTVGSVCVCGKKRGNLNSINWSRHLEACKCNKRKKLSHNYFGTNISNYFKSPNTISVPIKTNILSGWLLFYFNNIIIQLK